MVLKKSSQLKRVYAVLFPLFLFPLTLLAQTGSLSGTIVDGETGEELIGVTILIEGTTTGAITDVNGNYQIVADPGTYNLTASYVSYGTQTIKEVEVKAGENTRIDLSLASEDVQLGEVVIQADAINNNEVALLKLQKKSYAVQDGISAGEIQKLGISNAAGSMKQVTGAAVEDGKYVVMRGLGDRYSLTSLNGITLPSTDPYRNSSSMDLIPSSMVENIVATKTFTPDQPGNFTGGNVNITTKSLPDQFYLNFGVTLGYNTGASFRDDFLTDPLKGDLDWLGFDNGTRELPSFLKEQANLDLLSDQALFLKARSATEHYDTERDLFHRTAQTLTARSFIPDTKRTFLNNSYSLSFGDRTEVFNGSLGYNASFSFSKDYTNYNDRALRIFEYSSDPEATQLNSNFNTEGQQSFENTALGGILSLAYQINPKQEITFNTTYSHDAEAASGILTGSWPGAISGDRTFVSRNISFVERELMNNQLGGKHILPLLHGAELEWIAGITHTSQSEPDVRIFANDYRENKYALSKAEYDLPFHFFRNLEDIQYSGKLDLTIPLGDNTGNKIKVGGAFTKKERDFDEYRFQLGTSNPSGKYLSFSQAAGDLASFFSPQNAGILGLTPNGSSNVLGNYFLNQSRADNFYAGTEQVLGGYAMLVQKISDRLRFIGGARIEKTDFDVISESVNAERGVIDELDILPSLNLIFALNDKSNLRAAASQTLARPNMREMAPFTSVDFIGGYFFRGNPQLERTTIRNYDLRYEFFPGAGELIAASVFYKDFTDPIVKVLEPVASGGQLVTDNVDRAILYGIEVEFRKNITDKFQVGTNFTLIESEVELTEEELEAFKKVNPEIKDTRPFQAQSPFIWNITLSYSDYEKLFTTTLFSNMFGRRLYANGFGGAPDVYEIYGTNKNNIPAPDMNLVVSKGLSDHFELTFKFQNILGYDMVRKQEFKNQDFITESFNRGRTFSLGIKYAL